MIPEEAILAAARELLAGEVNDILAHIEEEEADEVRCPNLEVPSGFGAPPDRPGHFDLSIAQAETEEKDRIVKVSRYALTISVEASGRFPAIQCYRYAAAVERAVRENPTLGGVASYASVNRKTYAFPKVPEGGEPHRLTLTLTVCRESV
jgi:hypothetical protein